MSITMTPEVLPRAADGDVAGDATARGIMTGVALSVPLWALIILALHAVL